MGNFINLGNAAFTLSRNSEYVDKSGLITVVNSTIDTEHMFSCVTRSRRFGKSMAAKMLCAYYDKSCESRHLFDDLKIASDPSYEKHLNKYPLIYLDMNAFITRYKTDDVVDIIDEAIREDIYESYPDCPRSEKDDLMDCLLRVIGKTSQKFIFIIDEWDGILREFEGKKNVVDKYVDWLRRMFKQIKTADVFSCVYMTGILPIKKYNTESALNNFTEYSMVEPGDVSPFFGFTPSEVQALAVKHGMDYEELEKWYDGYRIGDESSIFNPNSVMEALRRRRCRSYWGKTGTYDAVAEYIQKNYCGLKDDIIKMLAGMRSPVDPTGFQNDLSEIGSRDDVLTVLIHLGYLTYDWDKEECFIPNREVAGEMANAVKKTSWKTVSDAIQQSKQLLEDTIRGNCEAVARAIDAIHSKETSILSYNDENSLSCVVSIAYYYARNDYIIHREYPSGYGFADLVFKPRENVSKPALIVELKQGHSAEEAIKQIKERKYTDQVREYSNDILLVGINYDEKSKHHSCIIEKA